MRDDVLIQGEIEEFCEVVYGQRAEVLYVSYIHVIRSSRVVVFGAFDGLCCLVIGDEDG